MCELVKNGIAKNCDLCKKAFVQTYTFCKGFDADICADDDFDDSDLVLDYEGEY